MQLVSLRMDQLPGITPSFTFAPAGPGVNLVTGPNAIGKSSLARALKHLLQPEKNDPLLLSLDAEFRSGDLRWRVRRNGGEVAWFRNGQRCPLSEAPNINQFSSYRLGMEALVADDRDDKALAQEIRRQLRGGFELDRLRQNQKLTSQFANKEARDLRTAQQARRGVENDYAKLRRQEADELPALERKIQAAQAAAGELDRLKTALRLAESVQAHKNREVEFQRFPPHMDRLLGDELERLKKLEESAQSLQEALRDQQRELVKSQGALAKTGLAESTPSETDLETARAHLQQIQAAGIERKGVQEACSKAAAAVREALAQFHDGGTDGANDTQPTTLRAQLTDSAADNANREKQPAMDPPQPKESESTKPPALDKEHLQQSESIARKLIAANERRTKLLERHKLASQPNDPQADIEQLETGLRALHRWLAADEAATSQTQDGPRTGGVWPLWLALLATTAAAAAALLQGAWLAGLGVGLAIAAIAWALLRRQRGANASGRASPREDAQRNFADSGLNPPEWRRDSVLDYLRTQIEGRLNKLKLRRERAKNAEEIARQLEQADERIGELEEQRSAFARKWGFDPSLPATNFDLFVRCCVNLSDATREQAQRRAHLAQLDEQIAKATALVWSFLAPWPGVDAPAADSSEEPPDATRLEKTWENFEKRVKDAKQAQDKFTACQGKIEDKEAQYGRIQADLGQLFSNAGLTPDQIAELAPDQHAGSAPDESAKRLLVDRMRQLGDWRVVRKALQKAEHEEELLREQLADQPHLVEQASAGALTELQEAHDAADAKAQRQGEWIRNKGGIQALLEQTGKDHALESALAKEQQAVATLEDKLEQALLHEATALLLDDVEQAFQSEQEPEVLKQAKVLFAEVTANAFHLDLGPEGAFTAWDVQQEEQRSLPELSSGTRMQLLLALRLAWTKAQEQAGEPWPIFLDEALTTSDEERFKVMAQGLERLAEAEGRQIFYLSARHNESALWRLATGSAPPTVDLEAVRAKTSAATAQSLQLEMPPRLPEPKDLSAHDYAALIAAPPIDPQQQPGAMHLFHLMRDDLTILHRLMDGWHIKNLGQLKGLLAGNAAASALPDAAVRQRLGKRCATARTWLELWRQGRGRPVQRGVLEQSGAVSDTFINQASELAAAKQGDGAALVQALRNGELPLFRHGKADDLEQWLVDNNYIDPRPILSVADRRRMAVEKAQPDSREEAQEVNQLLAWLETGIDAGPSHAPQQSPRLAAPG